MQIFNDWIQETLHDLESYVPTEKDDDMEVKRISQKHSSQILLNAESEIQAKIAAQMKAQMLAKEQQARLKQQQKEEIDKLADQLDSLAEDNDLLAGLEELDKKEKQEIEQRKSSKALNVEQGQGSTQSPKDEEEGNNSSYGLVGVVAALAIAGGIYAYRQSMRR